MWVVLPTPARARLWPGVSHARRRGNGGPMKRCFAVLFLVVLVAQVVGCKAKGEVDDNKDDSGMKVKVDTK